jgi:endonuclease III
MQESNKNMVRCPFCSQISHIIIVHGHGQCSLCGVNIDECCNGETCQKQLNDNSDDE